LNSIGFKIISHPLQRIAIIYNPNAGGLLGSNRARLDAAVDCLRSAGREVELRPTTGPNMAGELGRAAIERGFDLILAAGGDGTINEVLNGIVGSKVVFGVLPSGTANVLANEVGLSGRPDRAAAELLDAVPVRVAVGVIDQVGQPHRYFLLMAGIGLDARIVSELDLELKKKVGKLAYWHGGLRQLGREMPRFRITVNGREHVASFALISRVRNYGGDFEIAKSVRLTDNDFEIVIQERDRSVDVVRFLMAVLLNRLKSTSGISVIRAGRAVIGPLNGNPVHAQVDGEAIGALPATISIVPDAVTLLLPKRYAEG
jgi:YegS/Rv2252/BmrU family lipid kinase